MKSPAPDKLKHAFTTQLSLAGWRGMAWNGLARVATPLRISTGHRNTVTYPYPDIVVLVE